MWKSKGPKITKITLKKEKKKVRRPILHDFKTYYQAAVIKTVILKKL